MSSFKPALDPPVGDLALLTRSLVGDTIQASRESPRRRIIAPLHRSLEDELHRMLNALQPGTYVRPHRHKAPPKAEAWIVLRGAVLFLLFDDQGTVQQHVVLRAGGDAFGVDLVPGYYHSLIALEADTLIYEVKSGPYTAANDKEFASWAPEEGSSEAPDYMARLLERYGP